MFEQLAPFRKILVTGPHRSGTTIAARMIARDLGLDYMPEEAIRSENLGVAVSLFSAYEHFVLQAPALCRYAHMFGGLNDAAVVLMRRPVPEIIASQERVQWGFELLELWRYDRTDGRISEVKYSFWDSYQRDRILHPFEVEYASLKDHPLWLEAGQRTEFHARRTRL